MNEKILNILRDLDSDYTSTFSGLFGHPWLFYMRGDTCYIVGEETDWEHVEAGRQIVGLPDEGDLLVKANLYLDPGESAWLKACLWVVHRVSPPPPSEERPPPEDAR